LKLLSSKIPPVRHAHQDFFTRFGELANGADEICVLTGYVSTKSLLFVKANIESGSLPTIVLTIGMHAFGQFSRAQYDLVKEIAELLRDSNSGTVAICTAFPFHGKLYIFRCANRPQAALLGSSNLSGLDQSRQVFELDIEVEEEELLAELEMLHDDVRSKVTEDFLDWEPTKFKPSNLMAELPNTIVVFQEEVINVQNRIQTEYQLRLKCTPKSNMNVYHGKGRESKGTGLVRPRPWYEIEVIVSSLITSQTGYPTKRAFDVITDDGWKFRCKTSGDHAKNFRSEDNLEILGTWIKGRMEEAGKLNIGDVVTESHLTGYGRNYISLCSTDDRDLWFLSFKS